MTIETFRLDKFIGEVLGGAGLARTNRFEVIVNTPIGLQGYSDLVSLYCEQSSIPLLSINTKPYKIFGPSYQRPISSEFGGEGISMTFHVDRNMHVRKFFEKWMGIIVDPESFAVSYEDEYVGTVMINQLDEANNVTYSVTLEKAFPRNINIMELNHASTNQTHRLNVLFAYRTWYNTESGLTTPRDVQRLYTPQVTPSAVEEFPRSIGGTSGTSGSMTDLQRYSGLTHPADLSAHEGSDSR